MNYFKSPIAGNTVAVHTGPVLILLLLLAFTFSDANLSSVDHVPGAETVVELVLAETVEGDALDGVATVAVVDDCIPYYGIDWGAFDYDEPTLIPADCSCPGFMGDCDCNGC
jgi:hypothetical protein